MRMRKKPNLIPRMTRCQTVWIKEPEKFKGHWRDSFLPDAPLHVELGCGKGQFTAQMAAQNPNILFIALERVPEAMVVAMERVIELGLSNVFFLCEDVSLLQDFFMPGEIDVLYINFCDPWPGNRHAKRRLTNHRFLNLYRTVLKPEGEIQFKTDNRLLFEYSLEEYVQSGYQMSDVTYDLHANGTVGVMTDYEAKFSSQGIPICRCVAKLSLEVER